MSDQHHHRFMGCAGHDVQTPTMDGLAERGLRFSNTYCPFPLCGPSRMAFMTGRYPSTTGCLTNQCHLKSDVPTYAHGFGSGGYETILSGRMHFVGHDQRHGFDQRIIADCGGTAYINPVTGWKLEKVLGQLIDTPGMGRTPLRKSGPGHTGYHAYDRAVTETTVNWLHERGRRIVENECERPFMMTVGFVSPHCPFVAPPEDYALYDDKISVDDLPDPQLDGIHDVHRAIRSQWKLEEPIPIEWQRRTAVAYHGLCTFVDRQLGQIITALEESGLADNTIVVYTSDQGFFLGDHGWYDKRFMYEESLRMPFIIRYPRAIQAGSVNDDIITNVDFAPTFLHYAGIEIPGEFQGRSFDPLLEDSTPADWPQSMYYRYWMHLAHHHVYAHYGIRTRRYKLIYYYADALGQPGAIDEKKSPEWELFDLERDPHELNNVYHHPEYADTAEELRRELRSWQECVRDEPYPAEVP